MPRERQDLEGWLNCRNCKFRGRRHVARVGALMAQGSANMATFVQDVPVNGQGKSSVMSGLICQADAKKRCVEATNGNQ